MPPIAPIKIAGAPGIFPDNSLRMRLKPSNVPGNTVSLWENCIESGRPSHAPAESFNDPRDK